MSKKYTLRMSADNYRDLIDHLFPGDGDEHGAVILASIVERGTEVQLLGKELHLAIDGVDYLPGTRGYRRLCANFIREKIVRARDQRLVYLAIHNHAGDDSVAFSSTDMASHERGYQALLDVARGMPVGALVLSRGAIAGDIWLPSQERATLCSTVIVGATRRVLFDRPPRSIEHDDTRYHRQSLMFGSVGQKRLSGATVGIIGLGGAGAQLAGFLGRVGVGNFVLADNERVEITNLPRIDATGLDACSWLVGPERPQWLIALGQRMARRKIDVARRTIRRANPKANVTTIFDDFSSDSVARQFLDCDYLFLAADTMRARLVFNAVVHQYLIPGVQVGAKVVTNRSTGAILDIFSVVRPVTPDTGCLWCNGLINPSKLQDECLSPKQRREQAYVDDVSVAAPSVNTLNATATAHAANDFLFHFLGLHQNDATQDYLRFRPGFRSVIFEEPRRDPACPECGERADSRRACGDLVELPVIYLNK